MCRKLGHIKQTICCTDCFNFVSITFISTARVGAVPRTLLVGKSTLTDVGFLPGGGHYTSSWTPLFSGKSQRMNQYMLYQMPVAALVNALDLRGEAAVAM